MLECRHCGEVLREDPERLGSRCPRCRMPLYDRSDSLRREEATPADAKCAKHPLNWALGSCQRCGGNYCTICRSRWRDNTLCLACLEESLAELQKQPANQKAQRFQALGSLSLGILAWVLALTLSLPALGLPLLSFAAGQTPNVLTGVLGAVGLLSLLPALAGLGLGITAIRARAKQLKAATAGLCLCGAHLGLLIGIFVLPVLR